MTNTRRVLVSINTPRPSVQFECRQSTIRFLRRADAFIFPANSFQIHSNQVEMLDLHLRQDPSYSPFFRVRIANVMISNSPNKNQTFRQGDGLCGACSALFEDCVRDGLDWKCELIVDAARKLKIFSAHVRDHLDGKLPRKNDVATLARWDHEDAGERDGVLVGLWWYSLNHSTDKERLKRLRNFDEDSKHALQYLETCEPRKAKALPGRNAK